MEKRDIIEVKESFVFEGTLIEEGCRGDYSK